MRFRLQPRHDLGGAVRTVPVGWRLFGPFAIVLLLLALAGAAAIWDMHQEDAEYDTVLAALPGPQAMQILEAMDEARNAAVRATILLGTAAVLGILVASLAA